MCCLLKSSLVGKVSFSSHGGDLPPTSRVYLPEHKSIIFNSKPKCTEGNAVRLVHLDVNLCLNFSIKRVTCILKSIIALKAIMVIKTLIEVLLSLNCLNYHLNIMHDLVTGSRPATLYIVDII
jgi:hypothetical protein